MKKFITTLLFLALLSSCVTQPTIVREDLGKGWYIETPYIDGKKNGIETKYSEDGILGYKIPYVNGLKHGIGKSYYCKPEECSFYSEAPFVNDKIEGIVRGYEDGEVTLEVPYKDGKREGTAINYEDGKIVGETHYKNNKKEGLEIFSVDNAYMETPYVNGEIEGIAILKEGAFIIKTPYRKGEREGIAQFYDHGILIGEITYVNDSKKELRFFRDSQAKVELIFADDEETLKGGYCISNPKKYALTDEEIEKWNLFISEMSLSSAFVLVDSFEGCY